MSATEFSTNPQIVTPDKQPQPRNNIHRTPSGSLFRVIWRWHFYAGVFIGFLVIVMAVTGGIYLLQNEIEEIAYAHLQRVTPSPTRVSYQQQVDAATQAVKESFPDHSPQQLYVDSVPHRSTKIFFRGEPGPPFIDVFVNPHDGQVLGMTRSDQGLRWLFPFLLTIHRGMIGGTAGRIIVELTACWTIILVITGLCLWWPRNWRQVAGVWTLRRQAKTYTLLRDLHVLTGLYLSPFIVLIAATGLWYTIFMGDYGQHIANCLEQGKPIFEGRQKGNRPRPEKRVASSESEPAANLDDQSLLPLEEFVTIGQQRFPGKTISVSLRSQPANQIDIGAINPPNTPGPLFFTSLKFNRQDGTEIPAKKAVQKTLVQQWGNWNYPLHIGTILGMPSKIAWLIAVLSLVFLPVTGLWMWWQRRPAGSWGLPRRQNLRLSWWLIGTIGLLGILLPMAGLSIMAIATGDWLLQFLLRRFRKRPSPIPE